MNRIYAIIDKLSLDRAFEEGRIDVKLFFSVAGQTAYSTMRVNRDGTKCVVKADNTIPIPQLGHLTRGEYLRIRAAQENIGVEEYSLEALREILKEEEWQ